jgi:hypothetical protein
MLRRRRIQEAMAPKSRPVGSTYCRMLAHTMANWRPATAPSVAAATIRGELLLECPPAALTPSAILRDALVR